MLFRFTSIKDYQSSLLKGEISCTQVVQHYLNQIAKIRLLNGESIITHEEGLRQMTIKIDHQNQDLTSYFNDIQKIISNKTYRIRDFKKI